MTKSSSRRFQFSLKSLFFLALVAGLICYVLLLRNEAIRQTRIAERHAAEAMMQRDYAEMARKEATVRREAALENERLAWSCRRQSGWRIEVRVVSQDLWRHWLAVT